MAGRKATSGLFIEKDPEKGIYSLEEFKRVFLDRKDPSGYLCAQEVLTDIPLQKRWEEWKRLIENSWFRGRVEEWKDELEVAVRATAIQEITGGCNPKDFNTLKWLAEGRPFGEIKAGRPTKKETERKEKIKREVRNKLNPRADKVLDGAL